MRPARPKRGVRRGVLRGGLTSYTEAMNALWNAAAAAAAAAALGWACTGGSASQASAPTSLPAAAGEGRAGAAPPSPREPAPADPTVELRAQIERAIGSAACREDSQCRALALGSKPCGGPEGHLAWSTAGTDALALEALATRYKQAREARNQRLGLMSDCALVSPPALRCVPASGEPLGGTCRAMASRAGPAAATR